MATHAPPRTGQSAAPLTADALAWSRPVLRVLLLLAAAAAAALVAAGSMPWQLVREAAVVAAAVTSVLLVGRGSVRFAVALVIALACTGARDRAGSRPDRPGQLGPHGGRRLPAPPGRPRFVHRRADRTAPDPPTHHARRSADSCCGRDRTSRPPDLARLLRRRPADGPIGGPYPRRPRVAGRGPEAAHAGRGAARGLVPAHAVRSRCRAPARGRVHAISSAGPGRRAVAARLRRARARRPRPR